MTDQDVEDLTIAAARQVDRPAFYKDDFHFNQTGAAIARVLARNGHPIKCDPATGVVKASK